MVIFFLFCLVQIILTLRNNNSPDAAQQLFLTLSETSMDIEKRLSTMKERKLSLDDKVEDEENQQKVDPVLTVEE